MEFEGTKGEWKVAKSDGIKVEEGYKSKYVVETNELIVCDFIISKGYTRQAKYDAKLIAAAPELLKALQDIYNGMTAKCYTEHQFTKVEQAINKALK